MKVPYQDSGALKSTFGGSSFSWPYDALIYIIWPYQVPCSQRALPSSQIVGLLTIKLLDSPITHSEDPIRLYNGPTSLSDDPTMLSELRMLYGSNMCSDGKTGFLTLRGPYHYQSP